MSQDKDLPLREDIRLLGRLLGDTVRDQLGEASFALVERIRQHSVRFRRDEDLAARREGSLAHALDAAFAAGLQASDLAAFFEEALISPVLTAHPTEVQRKSILNCLMVIARLLDARDRMALTPEEALENEEALRRGVLTLWQTRMLRTTKLSVIDEVTNGLSYFDYTFLRELPRLYGSIEDSLAAHDSAWGALELPSFLQVGSWIGGDRDGNPFVTAQVLEEALARQATVALDFYLAELSTLASQLSLSLMHVSASEALLELADRSEEHTSELQ